MKAAPVRTWVFRSMLFSPALLLGFIGFTNRTMVDPYVFPAYSSATQKHITAYADIVRETRSKLRSGASADELQAVAELWIQGSKRGTLDCVYPAATEDAIQDGARGEIYETMLKLSQKLASAARHAAAAGDGPAVRRLCLTNLELAEVLKYSDFFSLTMLRGEQTRTLKLLQTSIGTEPAAQKEVAERLQILLDNQRPLDHLSEITRAQFDESQRRAGLVPVEITDPMAEDSPKGLVPARHTIVADGDSSTTEARSAIQIGEQAEESFKEVLRASIAHLTNSQKAVVQ